jgi:ribosome-associated protein
VNTTASAETNTPTQTGPLAAADMPERTRDLVLTVLDENKAEDLITIDLRGKTTMADYLVVATGNSARQVGAMAEQLISKLRDIGVHAGNAEGYPQCDWVLVDAGDVIVHLFRPEVRAFYSIEKMWGVELPASLNSLAPGYDMLPAQ